MASSIDKRLEELRALPFFVHCDTYTQKQLERGCYGCGQMSWELVHTQNRGGQEVYCIFCPECNHVHYMWQLRHDIVSSYGLEYRELAPPDDSKICAKCGAVGAENHHYGPRARFDDADKWPQGPLCPECHDEWHRVMDHAGKRLFLKCGKCKQPLNHTHTEYSPKEVQYFQCENCCISVHIEVTRTGKKRKVPEFVSEVPEYKPPAVSKSDPNAKRRMRLSAFIEDDDEPLTKAQHAFEKYIQSLGYTCCVHGVKGSAEACDFVGDFIDRHPEYEICEDEICAHANDIGPLDIA